MLKMVCLMWIMVVFFLMVILKLLDMFIDSCDRLMLGGVVCCSWLCSLCRCMK